MSEQAGKEWFPECCCVGVEVADGGEGTTDAVLSAVKGNRISVLVNDPLWKQHEAIYGTIDNRKVIMEMASASGLTLVPLEQRNPWNTTSYGTGEMIRDAFDCYWRIIYK